MAAFPVLKTGAVAQYPAERRVRLATVVQEFVDGSQQRFRVRGGALRRWVIQLGQLDDAELFDLEQFFEEQGGAAGVFTFTDPWDGTVYANCSFVSDSAVFDFAGFARGRASVTIRENRA